MAGAQGRAARSARILAHTQFRHREFMKAGLCENLPVYEGPLRLYVHFLEDLSAKQLEGTIYVAHTYTKDEPDQQIESPGEKQPCERVVTVDAKTAYHIVIFYRSQKILQLPHIELIVGIGIEDQIRACACESTAQSMSVSKVGWMMDYSYLGVPRSKCLADLTGAIAAAVVDYYHLVLRVGKGLEHVE